MAYSNNNNNDHITKYIKENLDNIQYEIFDDKNPNHLSIVNLHINSPPVLKYHEITNTSHNNALDYTKQREFSITNKDSLNKYHIIYIYYNGEYLPLGLFIISEYKDYNNSLMIAYSVNPKYQGLGIGMKIPGIIEKHIDTNFKKTKHIYAYVFSNNIASMKILERNGYIRKQSHSKRSRETSNVDVQMLQKRIDNHDNKDLSRFDKIVFCKDV